MEKKEDQSISQKITPSPKPNINHGLINVKKFPESILPNCSADSLEIIPPSALPDEIISGIGAALGIAHFAGWIPNAYAGILTADSFVELPPGSVIVLVFPETFAEDLPENHTPGKTFLIPS